MFVNSDAVVDRGCVSLLAAQTDRADVGLAMACIRLRDRPDIVNTTGNPLSIVGVAWAGGYGQPVTEFPDNRDVLVASGAVFAVRRDVWDDLGGFDPAYFAYHEDTELSIRAWQRGYRVRYVAAATALHAYEFHRNPRKNHLVERNRLFNNYVLWERRTVIAMLPPLLLFELGVLVLSARERWFRAKVSGYRWLWDNRRHLAERRALVQSSRRVPDRALLPMLTPGVTPSNVPVPAAMRVVNRVFRAYWSVAIRLL